LKKAEAACEDLNNQPDERASGWSFPGVHPGFQEIAAKRFDDILTKKTDNIQVKTN
jgi:hypothetical protein